MENYNEPTNQPGEQQEQEYSPAPSEGGSASPAPDGAGGSMFKIGSIIVILGVLVLGGLYFWGYLVDKEDADMSAEDAALIEELDNLLPELEEEASVIDELLKDVDDAAAAALGQQSASDAIADIEADLESTDLGDVNLEDLGF